MPGSHLPKVVRCLSHLGSALYLEEMLRMLVDDARLRRHQTTGGSVAADNLLDVHVPPTIWALLSARLDRLTSDAA
jgi:hypothetical protein